MWVLDRYTSCDVGHLANDRYRASEKAAVVAKWHCGTRCRYVTQVFGLIGLAEPGPVGVMQRSSLTAFCTEPKYDKSEQSPACAMCIMQVL